jgi:hypothetical protein
VFREGQIVSVKRAKRLEDNISNGRKIFRLLLFINEINELNTNIKDTKSNLSLKLLKILSSISSFNYYLFDNFVWLSQIGYVSRFMWGTIKWKKFKDLFSLSKTILEVIISNYVVFIKKRKESQIME